MSKHNKLAAYIYQDPWHVFPVKLEEITRAFERHSAKNAADAPVGPFDDEGAFHPQIECAGGVALARVHGVTGRRLSRMEMMCGGFDTGLFCEQCKLVGEDPAIHTLVIDFDSPGGLAAGSLATAQAIRAVAAAGKRTVAYASGDCCSAAYFMAAACDEIHADPEARVGSISTVCHGVDTSREWEKKGWELKLFATGKFKATGMDGKAWTAEEEEMMWERVRQFDSEFKGFVRERRPGLAEESMEGQWWNARHAPAGVVDSLDFPSLQLLVESIFAGAFDTAARLPA